MKATAPLTGPKGKPLVGSLFQYRRDPLGFLMRLARDYGDIVYFKIGPQDVFLLNHPDYIRDVLVTNHHNFHKSRGLELAKRLLGEGLLTSEDEFHRRQRRLAQPAFHRQRIASYATVMTEYPVRARERWQENETLDAGQEMMCLTLAIVAKTLFDADVEAEAMRLYPPAWVFGRRALSDYRVDKFDIPARSIVVMSPYVMHHDARYFPDPFKFDPERWTPEAKAARPKFSYFPFGGGPRVCIGESFAWMEAVLVVATMAQRWRLRLVSREPIEPKPLLTLRPKYPVRMKVERRG